MLTRGQWFEVAFWLVLAVGAFALTYGFNYEIEIYRFGAYGWPRVVAGIMFLAVLGQLYHDLVYGRRRGGSPAGGGETAAAGETAAPVEAGEARNLRYYLRMAVILGLPMLYAALLNSIGFFALTPFFIAAFLYTAGERRWKWILGITVCLYLFLVIVFSRLFYVGLPVGNLHPFYDFSNWLLVIIR